MIETLGGIKPAMALAGLVGSIVSLAFIKNLTPKQSAIAVFTGVTTSVYVSPVVTNYYELGMEAENGSTFLIGLLGMNFLAGLFKISEKFREAPLETASLLHKLITLLKVKK